MLGLEPCSGSFDNLEKLIVEITDELRILDYPSNDWVVSKKKSDGTNILDVAIIGGGQSGLTIAFALKKKHINNIVILDENSKGQEGPWTTYAMTSTLRSAKCITGPDCQVPSLTCEKWYKAKYGPDAWDSITKVSVGLWAEYLLWLRETLDLPVYNNTKVYGIYWDEEESCFVLPCGEGERLYARKVVLATGVQGSGNWMVPEEVKVIPRKFWSTVYEKPDFKALKGKKVGILGSGSSAFDAASASIDYGAKEVHIFCRRPKLVNLYFAVWGKTMGFLDSFVNFSDAEKWKFVWKMFDFGQMPDPDVVGKVRKSKQAFIHYQQRVKNISVDSNALCLEMTDQIHQLDYLLVAIGSDTDLGARPELSNIFSHIATWRDVYKPPPAMQNDYLLSMPYLGRNFEFCEKNKGEAPYLKSIFCCNGGSMMSFALNIGVGLSGMKNTLNRHIEGIVQQLYHEDIDHYYYTLENFDKFSFEN